MKIKCLLAVVASVWLAKHPFSMHAKEIINQNFADVQNVVSQNLVAAKSGDIEALQEAKDALPAIVSTDTIKIYRHVTDEETFFLKLKILNVANELVDKSFDPKRVTRAGKFGIIPWPAEEDRPESLKGKLLWRPRQNPDDYKETDPDLYAYYKPLYEENLRNTKKHEHQRIARTIRDDMLRDAKDGLKFECDKDDKSHNLGLYLRQVDEIIEDKQLRDEILSDIPPERRLPVSPSEEKTAP
jgi:hypothetical protein